MKRSSALFSGALLILSAVMSTSSKVTAKSSEAGVLLVANKGAQSLGIVNAQAGTQIVEVPEGGITGHEVIASPDGKTAFVPIYGNSGVGKPGTDGQKIAVVDLATRKVKANIDFDHGVRPHCPMFGPKDGLLYVTTEIDKTITVIDPKTLKIVGTIPTDQPESHMLAISPDGTRGYTANVGPGTVSVLDMEARKVLKVIPISKQTQRISVSTDGSMVFTSDQTKPQLAVIDTSSNTVKHWVPLPGLGYGTASTTDGKFLVVAVPTVNKVAVVDLSTMKVAHVIDVPKAPQEVLVRPDNKIAYVSCDHTNQVAAISIGDWKVEKLINTGKGADGLAWAAE
jgi:YVTN family beta-propeller protein